MSKAIFTVLSICVPWTVEIGVVVQSLFNLFKPLCRPITRWYVCAERHDLFHERKIHQDIPFPLGRPFRVLGVLGDGGCSAEVWDRSNEICNLYGTGRGVRDMTRVQGMCRHFMRSEAGAFWLCFSTLLQL